MPFVGCYGAFVGVGCCLPDFPDLWSKRAAAARQPGYGGGIGDDGLNRSADTGKAMLVRLIP